VFHVFVLSCLILHTFFTINVMMMMMMMMMIMMMMIHSPAFVRHPALTDGYFNQNRIFL